MVNGGGETGVEISLGQDRRGGGHQKRRGFGWMRIIPTVFDRSSWVFGESIKGFFTDATHSLSAAIFIVEGDLRIARRVVKVGGSVGEFSTRGRRGENHVSIGKSWIGFDPCCNACNRLYVAEGRYGRGEAASRPEYAVRHTGPAL